MTTNTSTNKILPVGVQNFESLIRDGYLYVDKTRQIWNLTHAGRHYFLARPRRFGKSLLISTLEAYFQGKRDLFEGLYMQDVETDWITYPVFHIDLSPENFTSTETLVSRLDWNLSRWEQQYGKEDVPRSLSERFENCIMRAVAATGQRVVILVDEYDKPILSTMENPTLQNEMRSILKAFYGVIKSQDGNIRFSLLTGITKFSKISIFSDLNNLNDISRDRRYYDICGISQSEMETTMRSYIEAYSEIQKTDIDTTYQHFRRLYDGYRFTSSKQEGIYNPFSVLSALERGEYGNYWFETGTPNFIVDTIRKTNYVLSDLTTYPIDSASLDSKDDSGHSIVSLLFQTGYLTIRDYQQESDLFYLDFPNDEVRSGFFRYILPYYTSAQKAESVYAFEQFLVALRSGDADVFLNRLNAFFADYQYDAQTTPEAHFQNVLYVLFRLLGLQTEAEYRTSDGRIDLLIRTQKYIYIIECKIDSSAQVALKQIHDKGYALPWSMNDEQIILIGVNFSTTTRRIGDWQVEYVETTCGNSGKHVETARGNSEKHVETPHKTSDKIVEAMRANPLITIETLQALLNLKRRTIEDSIARLKKDNRIRRKGSSTYGGSWEVLDE